MCGGAGDQRIAVEPWVEAGVGHFEFIALAHHVIAEGDVPVGGAQVGADLGLELLPLFIE